MRSDINSFNAELVLNVSTEEINDLQILKDTNLIYWFHNDRVFNNFGGLQNMVYHRGTGAVLCVDEYNGYLYMFTSNTPNADFYRTNLEGDSGVFLSSPAQQQYVKESFFDAINNKIYYCSRDYICSYDIATDVHTQLVNFNNWGGIQEPTDMTAFNLSSGNPTIMVSVEYNGAIYSVNADGTGYQVVVTDGNLYGVDIQQKTGTIQGSVFLDINYNGNYDTSEIPLGNQILELENIDGEKTYLTTKSNGNYRFDVDTSQYTLRFFTDTLWTETSNTYSYSINVGPDTLISDLNFGIAPQITKGDMFVDITTSSTRT